MAPATERALGKKRPRKSELDSCRRSAAFQAAAASHPLRSLENFGVSRRVVTATAWKAALR
jgi:hypothetical protein